MGNEFEKMANNRPRKELLSNNDLRKFTEKESKIGMSERNKEIVRKHMDGKSYSQLAKEYDVSFNRVRKIVMEFMKRVKLVQKGVKTYEY